MFHTLDSSLDDRGGTLVDLITLSELLWRRRYAVMAAAIVALALLGTTLVVSPPTYRVTSTIVLLNPPTPPTEQSAADEVAAQNPYARFGDLSIVVDILRRVMTSAPVEESLAEQGLEGAYTVAANVDFTRGPIIDVAVEATSKESAIASNQLVVAELIDQLTLLQDRQGTSEFGRITVEVVVPPSVATRVLSSTLRRMIVVGVLGVAFVIATAVGAEAVAVRRRQGVPAGSPRGVGRAASRTA